MPPTLGAHHYPCPSGAWSGELCATSQCSARTLALVGWHSVRSSGPCHRWNGVAARASFAAFTSSPTSGAVHRAMQRARRGVTSPPNVAVREPSLVPCVDCPRRRSNIVTAETFVHTELPLHAGACYRAANGRRLCRLHTPALCITFIAPTWVRPMQTEGGWSTRPSRRATRRGNCATPRPCLQSAVQRRVPFDSSCGDRWCRTGCEHRGGRRRIRWPRSAGAAASSREVIATRSGTRKPRQALRPRPASCAGVLQPPDTRPLFPSSSTTAVNVLTLGGEQRSDRASSSPGPPAGLMQRRRLSNGK